MKKLNNIIKKGVISLVIPILFGCSKYSIVKPIPKKDALVLDSIAKAAEVYDTSSNKTTYDYWNWTFEDPTKNFNLFKGKTEYQRMFLPGPYIYLPGKRINYLKNLEKINLSSQQNKNSKNLFQKYKLQN